MFCWGWLLMLQRRLDFQSYSKEFMVDVDALVNLDVAHVGRYAQQADLS
jgi:hypothetical protein